MKSGATPDEKNEGKWTYRLSNKVTLPRLDPQYLQKRRKRKKKKKPKISLFETLSLSFCLSAEPKQSKARKIEISKEFMKTDWGIYRKQVLMVTVHLWDTYQRRTKLTTGNAR